VSSRGPENPAHRRAPGLRNLRQGPRDGFFSIDEQDEWGKQFSLYNLIPSNTDGRRVFGYLRAREDGCDVLISIDDDNFPSQDDFVGRHRITGQEWRQPRRRLIWI